MLFRSTLVGCNNAVTRLDFDFESRLLLGASNDHGVRLWNVDNQRLVVSLIIKAFLKIHSLMQLHFILSQI